MSILTQLTLNTSELATWFIGAVITAMCVLLYNLLKDLKENQKQHADELKTHGETLVGHGVRIDGLEDKVK